MLTLITRTSARASGMLALVCLLSLSRVGLAQNPLGPFGPNSVNWPIAAGGNGHIYEPVGPLPITWPAANAAALAAGGHLATITSAAENTFVFGLVNNVPGFWNFDRGPWLGGHQKPGSTEPDGGWTWVTGEPFTFTHWQNGPNNGPSMGPGCNLMPEDCLHFIGSGIPSSFPLPIGYSDWNDAFSGCTWNGYIVEYDVELRCPCTPTGFTAENPPPNNVCVANAFTLCVARLSNGSARLQVFNLPTGTANGKVLVSTVPAFPVGSGAFFGLNFDLTLLVPILFSSFAVGDPLSWLIADPGFSPEQPFFVPAGTMLPFAGQTWDFVAVAVVPGASGLTYNLSNYVQRTWP
jgi:Lectin C-type domain